jgi:hypothetical protein
MLAACVLAMLTLLPASAQDPGVAGLVVDYGDGRVSYAAVPFDGEEINGLDLLNRSGLDVVTVGFGGLGDAVCQVGDTGCSVDDCRTRMCQTSDPESPFWQFSKLQGDEWQFVATGASGAKVRDGDIYAWSWTGTPPELPVLTMAELVERAGGDPLSQDEPRAFLRTEGGESNGDEGGGLDPVQIGALAAVVAVAAVLVLRGALTRPKERGDVR